MAGRVQTLDVLLGRLAGDRVNEQRGCGQQVVAVIPLHQLIPILVPVLVPPRRGRMMERVSGFPPLGLRARQ
jgi:hypothetical protein